MKLLMEGFYHLLILLIIRDTDEAMRQCAQAASIIFAAKGGNDILIQIPHYSERKTSLGKDWHGSCLRCEKCNKTLTPGGHAEHEGKPYCNHPCYSALFGPGDLRNEMMIAVIAGFGRGGAESYVYNK
ncbi:Cysteine-rich protein 1 [Trachymyrmex cornetzi]|uniref:Cysteine-rich protein 1 n=1 Tax=Trachymyrmex cornetzi TaxID=471704 RepID=A0A195DXU3_9HYME|nr:Cysteine-rich protein 1 [Trachymyrmex cornetzi]